MDNGKEDIVDDRACSHFLADLSETDRIIAIDLAVKVLNNKVDRKEIEETCSSGEEESKVLRTVYKIVLAREILTLK